jgi:hypothetical protein
MCPRASAPVQAMNVVAFGEARGWRYALMTASPANGYDSGSVGTVGGLMAPLGHGDGKAWRPAIRLGRRAEP